jgi:hypothetical protein
MMPRRPAVRFVSQMWPAPIGPGPAARRRGASLAELLAVMTAMGVVMSVSAGLVHTGMRLQSSSRQDLERDRTAMRLARQFRDDVRQALSVKTAGTLRVEDLQNDPSATVLRLVLPADTTVEYRGSPKGLSRLRIADGRTAHEDFVFDAPLQWTAAEVDECLVLTGRPLEATAASQREPRPLEVEVVAAMRTGGLGGQDSLRQPVPEEATP